MPDTWIIVDRAAAIVGIITGLAGVVFYFLSSRQFDRAVISLREETAILRKSNRAMGVFLQNAHGSSHTTLRFDESGNPSVTDVTVFVPSIESEESVETPTFVAEKKEP